MRPTRVVRCPALDRGGLSAWMTPAPSWVSLPPGTRVVLLSPTPLAHEVADTAMGVRLTMWAMTGRPYHGQEFLYLGPIDSREPHHP